MAVCPVCKKRFELSVYQVRRRRYTRTRRSFCSSACQHKGYQGSGNPNYNKDAPKEGVCAHCGKLFPLTSNQRSNALKGSTTFYCGKECRYASMKGGILNPWGVKGKGKEEKAESVKSDTVSSLWQEAWEKRWGSRH